MVAPTSRCTPQKTFLVISLRSSRFWPYLPARTPATCSWASRPLPICRVEPVLVRGALVGLRSCGVIAPTSTSAMFGATSAHVWKNSTGVISMRSCWPRRGSHGLGSPRPTSRACRSRSASLRPVKARSPSKDVVTTRTWQRLSVGSSTQMRWSVSGSNARFFRPWVAGVVNRSESLRRRGMGRSRLTSLRRRRTTQPTRANRVFSPGWTTLSSRRWPRRCVRSWGGGSPGDCDAGGGHAAGGAGRGAHRRS